MNPLNIFLVIFGPAILGLILILLVFIISYRNEDSPTIVEKKQIEKAAIQGDCPKGGNVKNKDNVDITKGVDVTTSLQNEINNNSSNNAVSPGWWESNDVCPGDNVFKQLVIQPKGLKTQIAYGPPPAVVDTTISKWKKI